MRSSRPKLGEQHLRTSISFDFSQCFPRPPLLYLSKLPPFTSVPFLCHRSPSGQEVPHLELHDPDPLYMLGKNLPGIHNISFEVSVFFPCHFFVCLFLFNTSISQGLFILYAQDIAVNKTDWIFSSCSLQSSDVTIQSGQPELWESLLKRQNFKHWGKKNVFKFLMQNLRP